MWFIWDCKFKFIRGEGFVKMIIVGYYEILFL